MTNINNDPKIGGPDNSGKYHYPKYWVAKEIGKRDVILATACKSLSDAKDRAEMVLNKRERENLEYILIEVRDIQL